MATKRAKCYSPTVSKAVPLLGAATGRRVISSATIESMKQNRLLGALVIGLMLIGSACNDDPTFIPVGAADTGDGGAGADATAGADTEPDRDVVRFPDVPSDTAPDTPEDTAPDDVAPDTPEDTAPDSPDDVAPDTPEDIAPDSPDDVTPDTPEDTVPDAPDDIDPGDTEPDVVEDTDRPAGCGNGRVDPGEECDDGNDIDNDECSNECIESWCGDGTLNATLGNEAFPSPVVVDPSGAEGYVCDDGATCPAAIGTTTCDTADIPNAPEHGICQSLGFDFAVEVTWGGGLGAGSEPMPHAFNWECFGYECGPGPFPTTAADCTTDEMLAEIVCEGIVGEECDDGELNGDVADACRLDCTLPLCGDGITDSDEECDDANDIDDDECRDSCMAAACGDGVLQVVNDEECDDGADNANVADACRTTCVLPACMDGIVDTGEECDDGNDVNADGCSNICRVPGCRDGVLAPELGEECDDGNDIPDDGCSNNCLLPQCGDGVTQETEGEECDDGDDDDTNDCRNDCSLPRCGDGVRSDFFAEETFTSPVVTGPTGATGHVCDDGSSCSVSTCVLEDDPSAPEHGICQALGYEICIEVTWGDGEGDSDSEMPHAHNWGCVDYVCGPGTSTYDGDNCSRVEMLNTIHCAGGYSEVCDEGDGNSDEVGATCRTDCTLPRCGDGVHEPARDEECDDGNDIPDDGCSNICRLPQCGDAVIQGDEECDDGTDSDTDECRIDCTLQVCGDGHLADAEDCDAGELNADEPDSLCRTDCTNPRCGDGIVDSGEACDDGNRVESDLCLSTCEEARCGDGVRHRILGEDCDDGNRIDDDGCANDCTGDVTGFACADEDLGSDVGEPAATWTTEGRENSYEATCAGSARSPDIAFNWVAPSTGLFEINTTGSDYDTSLHIRTLPETPTDDDCLNGPQLACDDDGGTGLDSLINLDAEMGREYLIIVDGFSSSSSGPFVLNIIPR